MRVGIFHNRYLQRGGEDTAVDAETELLAKGGHAVSRLVVDNRDVVAGRRLGALRTGLRARWNPATVRRVERFLAEHPIDVAHVHNFFPALSASLHAALSSRGVPVVQTLHNYRLLCANGYLLREGRVCEECVAQGPWNAVRHGCYRGSRLQTAVWADATAHHRARGTWDRDVDRFAVPTDFARRKLLSAGLPPERVEVLPLFVPDPGDPTPPGEGAVFAGRLSPEKGVDLLVDAWRELGGAPLTVLGSGPAEAALRERARGVAGVRFAGAVPRDAVLAAIRAAAFVVVPSRWYEISPYGALEALACGRPVVAWREGAVAELVEAERTGLLYARPEPTSVASACRRLLDDADLVGRLGAEARERYLERFAPEPALARLELLYDAARDERRRRGPLPPVRA